MFIFHHSTWKNAALWLCPVTLPHHVCFLSSPGNAALIKFICMRSIGWQVPALFYLATALEVGRDPKELFRQTLPHLKQTENSVANMHVNVTDIKASCCNITIS